MGIIHIMERGGEEERRFKHALMQAKDAIEEICELSEQMEDQYADERMSGRGYSRGGYSREGYGRDEGGMGMEERRMRNSRGRYM